MHKKFVVLIVCFVISIFGYLNYFKTLSAVSPINNNSSKTESNYVPGEVIVKFKTSVSVPKLKTGQRISSLNMSDEVRLNDLQENTLPNSLVKLDKTVGVKGINTVASGLGGERNLKIELNNPDNVFLAIKQLNLSGEVEFAEPNYIIRAVQIPNDPYYLDSYPGNVGGRDTVNWNPSYDYLWGLKKMGMETAWGIAGSQTVIVAVVDTGTDYSHPELGGCTLAMTENGQCLKVVAGTDIVNNDSDPMDDNGHGTHVSGTIAAITNNGIGISGISPNAKIMPVKVLSNDGSGTSEGVASGINYAVEHGAKVINMSLGANGTSGLITEAVTNAYNNGVVFVAAAGNSNSDAGSFIPSNITCATDLQPNVDCVISVAATDQTDARSSYSNWGPSIDISAPGGDDTYNILSLKSSQSSTEFDEFTVGDRYVRLSGTSMSAPHVSGLAALILGKNPGLNPDQVRSIILNSADDLGNTGYDIYYGYGRINAGRALTEMDTTPPPVARITSPKQNILIGNRFEIKGTSRAGDFQKFMIEYAPSVEEYNWSREGITLTTSGLQPVTDGLLATVDLSRLTIANGTLYFRLTTVTNSGMTAVSILPVKIDQSIVDGFPVEFGSDWLEQKPVIADINLDSVNEIIFKNQKESKIVVLKSDGTPLSGWPKSTGESHAVNYRSFSPTVADLDPQYPGLEIIVGSSENGASYQLLAFHADGTSVSGWTASDWHRRGDLGSYQDVVPVFWKDNNPVLVYGEQPLDRFEGAKVHLFNSLAEDLANWPVSPSNNLLFTNAVRISPVVADINKDGENEVIITDNSQSKIGIYSLAGNLIKEFSVTEFVYQISTVAVGDLDGDGYGEIIAGVFPSDYFSLLNNQKRLYVWDYQGNLKSDKWPYVFKENSGNYGDLNLSLGDFNNDGNPEILTSVREDGKNKNYAFDKNANILPGFPTEENDGIVSSVNIGIEGGNQLFTYGTYWASVGLKEYNPVNGQFNVPAGYPKLFGEITDPTIYTGFSSLADINNDGKTEMIVPVYIGGSVLANTETYLYVFKTGFNSTSDDWPQYYRDAQHSGVYNNCPSGDLGNLDCDTRGLINISDLTILLSTWCPDSPLLAPLPGRHSADIQVDGHVNISDLTKLLSHWKTE